MYKNVLEVKNLTKKFGNFTAVDNISFEIKDGEILGLLGKNGAGKTTTIQMLLGIMDQTSGAISYFEKDFKRNREEILKDVNFSSSYITLPWLQTVEEILNVYAMLYSIPKRKERIKKLIEEFDAESLFKKSFFMLSAGEKSKILLVKAFLNYPKILLLDEPTASLDPDIAKKIRDFLKKEKKEFNVSMLFTSHNMSEVEEMCDRVIFIDNGKIIAEDTPFELAKRNGKSKIRLLVKNNQEKLINFLSEKKIIFEKEKNIITITTDEKEIAKFLNLLAQNDFAYEDIVIDKPSLEDFFLEISTSEKL